MTQPTPVGATAGDDSSVKIAVLGAGHWGPNLIRNFERDPRSRVSRIVEPDPARLDEVLQRFPGISGSSDPQDAFDDPEVDAVVIATPTSTHYELAARSLEAGKHVLVEKPIADTVAKARELCRLQAHIGRVLMVGHVFVYNSAARFIKDCIDRGHLGRVYYLSMVRTNLGPIRVDVNAAWDLAAHDISLANYWLGCEPVAISASGGSWINPGIEDAVFATVRYPNDILVNLHASWLNPRKARDITVVGDERMLTFDDVDVVEPVRIYDKQVREERRSAPFVDTFESFRMVVREGKVTVPAIVQSQPLMTECEHFLDCVLEGRVPDSGPSEGLAVVRVLAALSRSLEQGGREIEISQVDAESDGSGAPPS